MVTDGQMSGLVNKGLVVAEVSPEGAVGGPLGLVRDGDIISVDVDARTIDLEVREAELAERRAALPATPRRPAAAGFGLRPHGTPTRAGGDPGRVTGRRPGPWWRNIR